MIFKSPEERRYRVMHSRAYNPESHQRFEQGRKERVDWLKDRMSLVIHSAFGFALLSSFVWMYVGIMSALPQKEYVPVDRIIYACKHYSDRGLTKITKTGYYVECKHKKTGGVNQVHIPRGYINER